MIAHLGLLELEIARNPLLFENGLDTTTAGTWNAIVNSIKD
jgi:hypothetical protein